MSDEVPEPDRLEGAPHPRDTQHLYGQAEAEAAFLKTFNTGRLPHAWLITGPKGIGKATFAWRAARFLLASPHGDGGGLFGAPPPPESLDVDPDLRVARHVRALTHPGLYLLRRGWDDKKKVLRSQITVDDMRAMKGFFALSAADGGRRVVIIDDADEMTPNAANALLKVLEEPPAGAVILLISHQPFRLLPTIRSRCRMQRLSPLAPADLGLALAAAGGTAAGSDAVALAELAGGSVGTAMQLIHHDGLALYRDIVGLMGTLPRLNRTRAIAVSDAAGGRSGETRFDLTVTMLDLFLARLARAGTTGSLPPEAAPGETALFPRLAPDLATARLWADCAQLLGTRARRGKAVNLDPAALLMDMFLKIDESAGRLASR